MAGRIVFSLLACMLLSGCSYTYDILAVVQHGRLMFVVDPKSSHHPSCLREIEVTARSGNRATATSGDDESRVGYGTFWFESVDHADGCANTYPLPYGSSLSGKVLSDREKVTPKPLLREVEYEVRATTGATGYGGGQFILHRNGQVENLPREKLEAREAANASNSR
jgi:hypothetical protein